ncbi:DNA mismatch repair protein [Arachis hypogaea]|nr:DNA mismatch repair protein [Arachis hypogaea]
MFRGLLETGGRSRSRSSVLVGATCSAGEWRSELLCPTCWLAPLLILSHRRVIQRKLVQVITPSTTVEGNIGPDANHLLAIKEGSTILDDGSVVYGFAFVDCARLRFWVGSIDGDASYSALGALLMQACFGTS